MKDLYLDFRKEIDELSFPLLLQWSMNNNEFREIKYNNEVVGFLMVIEGYVDGIYVKPNFRRKGLAKKAVLDYLKEGGTINTLHIVKTNKNAEEFWRSLFVLKKLDECPVDTLYQVVDTI